MTMYVTTYCRLLTQKYSARNSRIGSISAGGSLGETIPLMGVEQRLSIAFPAYDNRRSMWIYVIYERMLFDLPGIAQ